MAHFKRYCQVNKIDIYAGYLFAFLIAFYYSGQYSNLDYLNNNMLIIMAMPVFALKFLSTNFDIKEILVTIILCFLAVCNYLITGEVAIALLIFLILSMKNVDFKKICSIFLYTYLIVSLIIILSSLVGFIDNTCVEAIRGGRQVFRYSLGFGHPNTLALRFFSIVTLYFFVYGNQLTIKKGLVLFFINFLIYIISGSRTSFILLNLFLLFFFLFPYYYKIKYWRFITNNIYIISFLVVFLIIYFYNTSFIQFVDKLLMYRFSFLKLYLDNVGINLFGNSVHTFDVGEVLDMGWANLILKSGIIFSAFYSLIYTVLLTKIINKNFRAQYVFAILYCFYGFTENILYSISFNPTLLMFSFLIFDSVYKQYCLENISYQCKI